MIFHSILVLSIHTFFLLVCLHLSDISMPIHSFLAILYHFFLTDMSHANYTLRPILRFFITDRLNTLINRKMLY